MTPLDLRKASPRSPRAELRGLCMVPRMIDIARGTLPGGDVGEYQIGRGLSAVVLRTFDISVPQFVEAVHDAQTEDDVAEFLWPTATAPLEALSARLRRVRVADVPPDLLADFQRLYGSDIPADRCLFDLLDTDDAKAFSTRQA
jgi:hypothetical protein